MGNAGVQDSSEKVVTLTSVISKMRESISKNNAWKTPEEYQKIIDDYRRERREKQSINN